MPEDEPQMDPLEDRKELIQDVIDRLLSNPEYRPALIALNAQYQPNQDYNRRLSSYRTTDKPSEG